MNNFTIVSCNQLNLFKLILNLFKFNSFFSFWNAKDESGINAAELDQNLPIKTPYWLNPDSTQKVKKYFQ